MKNTIKIKSVLGTLFFTVMAWMGQGLTAAQSADEPGAAEESSTVAATAQEKVSAKDQVALQGTWKLVLMRTMGEEGLPPADNEDLAGMIARMKLEFKGDRLITTPAEIGGENVFKLDPTAKPFSAIDILPVDDGNLSEDAKKFKTEGIYALNEDELVLCLASGKRPTRMSAEREDGFGQKLYKFKRVVSPAKD